ncbi:MAG: twin-arginine translocase TatA/TatE family subunit [Bdellovibrionales bacterium CG12_big_fil_rev_8_21_14_0_65_38_15]|nr:MAG: twin-arginine translocase TatA/TatE family subunit [Bdellovibrionales bacterium CG22_combo_CG10-13_8_21_14_all_38_13]PIQ55697.1 MAG: twin-arginine translocase TatA/TatE family subunit [Bdellovibrionales bacterium CG12_big_fil_rev_8_21_14_0_65_38_15]PIR30707.1 MAG: twin-arginine translocase TatA/TatE family subunit [Bdellovibrionales bacterium CG11_big_fil_rev_8_21_14_0_20_38_13]
MFGLGTTEALIVLAIIVLMFGGRKLPELGRSMGKAITNFKQGMKDDGNDKDKKVDPPEDNS